MHKVKIALWTIIIAAVSIIGTTIIFLLLYGPNGQVPLDKVSMICSLFSGSIIGSSIYAIRNLN